MCLLINDIYGMSFRDNLLKYNHLCFGRDSGFLAVVRYVLLWYFKEKRKNGADTIDLAEVA